ncbi:MULTISPECIES: Fe-S cluster assembly protein NifU [Candidatus Avelusimicrobium]|uniref:Fe-S cluster assembly protein NifU n=1 Tax=Candidatus Avelusimicrobium TaxID=2840538 RepID=UPI000EC5A780|nr:Fe-S cluster assembly protein NifU [Elusimicrobiota bacterium]
MWDYTEKVMDHFKNPRNVGAIPNADGTGQVGSLVCGDALKLTIKVNKDTDVIEDAKFETFGCASAIASSSILTEMVKGKTIAEASKITNQDIADALGTLPAEKMHCSVMGMEALEAAVKSYREGGKAVVFEQQAEKIVCHCFNVSEETIIKAIRANHLKTVEDVTHFTKAGGGCGRCKGEIQKILDKVNGAEAAANAPKTFAQMTLVEKIRKIEQVLESDVRPMLNMDGGSAELVDLNGTVVKVRLVGMCSGCAGAAGTLKHVIEKALQEKVDPSLTVEQA